MPTRRRPFHDAIEPVPLHDLDGPIDEQVEEQPVADPVHVPEVPANEVFEVPPAPIPEPTNERGPIYQRQATLGLTNPVVVLIGCGGVGCWVALSLILGGVDDITLFDGDSISSHNLNRFPLPESFVGEMKSVALANWLSALRPKADIKARGEFDPLIHQLGADWIICATDSLKSRRYTYDYAKKIGAKYLEVGADGERWGLSPTPPEFSTELEDNPGYQTVPVHVGPCMMAGAAAAYYVLHNIEPQNSHSCDWTLTGIRSSGATYALGMRSISEVSNNGMIPCPVCGVAVEVNRITLCRHLRDHRPEMSLVESVRMADAVIDALTPEAALADPNPFGPGTPNTLGAADRAAALDMAMDESPAIDREIENESEDDNG